MSTAARTGLLVMNPKATTATMRTCEVLVGALSSLIDLRTVPTERRGHAAELARSAADDGVDVVIAFGGDGTVNEVVTGLLAKGPRPGLPALAVVPGGSTNVFARALGLPNHAVEATGALLRLLREDRTRTVSVGAARCDDEAEDRYFTFSAGYGFDAAVVGAVERHRAAGRRSTGALYIRSALTEYARGDRKAAPIRVQAMSAPSDSTSSASAPSDSTPSGMGSAEQDIPPLFMAVLSNTAPWTYLRNRPILATSRANFDSGLDLFGLATMSPVPVWRAVGQLLANSKRLDAERGVVVRHDLPGLILSAQRPTAFQVDGDYLGPRERVTFRSVPDALRVFA